MSAWGSGGLHSHGAGKEGVCCGDQKVQAENRDEEEQSGLMDPRESNQEEHSVGRAG